VRTLAYTYDGLQRLTGAVESPGSSYAYQYDVAGNRTQVAVNGTTTQQHSYDAANQVVGWTYDAAGNLTGDGISTYSYDALGRLTAGTSGAQSSTYSYNGDGTLVGQASGGVTTGYAQDLAGGRREHRGPALGPGPAGLTTRATKVEAPSEIGASLPCGRTAESRSDTLPTGVLSATTA